MLARLDDASRRLGAFLDLAGLVVHPLAPVDIRGIRHHDGGRCRRCRLGRGGGHFADLGDRRCRCGHAECGGGFDQRGLSHHQLGLLLGLQEFEGALGFRNFVVFLLQERRLVEFRGHFRVVFLAAGDGVVDALEEVVRRKARRIGERALVFDRQRLGRLLVRGSGRQLRSRVLPQRQCRIGLLLRQGLVTCLGRFTHLRCLAQVGARLVEALFGLIKSTLKEIAFGLEHGIAGIHERFRLLALNREGHDQLGLLVRRVGDHLSRTVHRQPRLFGRRPTHSLPVLFRGTRFGHHFRSGVGAHHAAARQGNSSGASDCRTAYAGRECVGVLGGMESRVGVDSVDLHVLRPS